jgi:sialate O-acetylesterase
MDLQWPVAVGLINASVGATAAERWTGRPALEAHPELKDIASIPPSDGGPSSLYHAMIAPLQPYAIAGVIWHQGESNNQNAKQYQTLFPAMIRGWRDDWNQGEFPFLFVQITPHHEMLPEIREAQLISWRKTPKTAMIVTTDCGHPTDIHPRGKEPVGARLALAARALAYGRKIEYSGPVYESMKVAGNRVILSFSHVGGGLIAKDAELKGFTIAGADHKHVPAVAKIEGETVVVTSSEVAKPVAVRYGWANVPEVNLFNQAGLPASPFRTDVPE